MWGRSTKQRKAAMRRRFHERLIATGAVDCWVTPWQRVAPGRLASAAALLPFHFDASVYDAWVGERDVIAPDNALVRALRPGSRFVCALPRDGFMQKPPKGEC